MKSHSAALNVTRNSKVFNLIDLDFDFDRVIHSPLQLSFAVCCERQIHSNENCNVRNLHACSPQKGLYSACEYTC